MIHVGCHKIRLPHTVAAAAAGFPTVASDCCKVNSSIGILGHYEWKIISKTCPLVLIVR